MAAMKYLPLLGCLITMALGALGAFAPQKAAMFVSVEPKGRTGVSELRATYGGLFLGMGLTGLQNEAAFAVAAACWCGAAVLRAFSVFLDQSFSTKNLRAIGVEGAIGALFAVGTF